MPGLSPDPQKRQRQLDALAGGRRAQAERLFASPGSAPAQPRQPAAQPGQPGELPVHDYAKPKPRKPRKERAPRAQEQQPPAEDQPRRRGFLDALRHGAEL